MANTTSKRPNDASSPEASPNEAGADSILQIMRENGLPMTRLQYMAISKPEADPEDWTAEEMMEIPEELT